MFSSFLTYDILSLFTFQAVGGGMYITNLLLQQKRKNINGRQNAFRNEADKK